MKKQFRIKYSNMPVKLPIISTVVLFIALDHWNASDLIRGIFYTLYGMIWIIALISVGLEKSVDLFDFDKDEPQTEGKAKSKFQEKLEKMAKERGYKS